MKYLEFYFGRDFIIQECVEQSEYISQFNPSSVNTLRLSMYRSVKDNKCHITVEAYSSWLFQYTIGTAFGKFTDEIIDYCKDNRVDIEEILHL